MALCEAWSVIHAEHIQKATNAAQRRTQEQGRAWTLHADAHTRAVIADCPEKQVSPQTAEKYRRAYELLCAERTTAFGKAKSVQHWNFLRSATRYCMEQDIRTFRRMSERSREAGKIELAKAQTIEAFRLGIALDEQFLKTGHKTWADKARAVTPVNKSKRNSKVPEQDFTAVLLLNKHHRGEALVRRHAERLAILALSGCRPSELMKGVELELRTKGKNSAVIATIHGAKTDNGRGQKLRKIAFTEGVLTRGLVERLKETGGKLTVTTTSADYRSLNRALKAHDLSCYSFRHQIGSDLKGAIKRNEIQSNKVAEIMGHASTRSITFYGTASKASGRKPPTAKGTSTVRERAVSYDDRRKKRTERKQRTTHSPQLAEPFLSENCQLFKIPLKPVPPSW